MIIIACYMYRNMYIIMCMIYRQLYYHYLCSYYSKYSHTITHTHIHTHVYTNDYTCTCVCLYMSIYVYMFADMSGNRGLHVHPWRLPLLRGPDLSTRVAWFCISDSKRCDRCPVKSEIYTTWNMNIWNRYRKRLV